MRSAGTVELSAPDKNNAEVGDQQRKTGRGDHGGVQRGSKQRADARCERPWTPLPCGSLPGQSLPKVVRGPTYPPPLTPADHLQVEPLGTNPGWRRAEAAPGREEGRGGRGGRAVVAAKERLLLSAGAILPPCPPSHRVWSWK